MVPPKEYFLIFHSDFRTITGLSAGNKTNRKLKVRYGVVIMSKFLATSMVTPNMK